MFPGTFFEKNWGQSSIFFKRDTGTRISNLRIFSIFFGGKAPQVCQSLVTFVLQSCFTATDFFVLIFFSLFSISEYTGRPTKVALGLNHYITATVQDTRSSASPSDRAMRLVSSNLANCHATVQKLLI